jgi:hypothetical protein
MGNYINKALDILYSDRFLGEYSKNVVYTPKGKPGIDLRALVLSEDPTLQEEVIGDAEIFEIRYSELNAKPRKGDTISIGAAQDGSAIWQIKSEIEDQIEIKSLCAFEDYLYAGSADDGKVYRSNNAINWETVFDSAKTSTDAMCVYGGALYIAQSVPGEILRTENGTDWESVYQGLPGIFDSGYRFCEFDGYLYMSTLDSPAQIGQEINLYRSATGDAGTWLSSHMYISNGYDGGAIKEFKGYLYYLLGDIPATRPMLARSLDGVSFTPSYLAWNISDIEECNEYLYFVTETNSVYRSSDGVSWGSGTRIIPYVTFGHVQFSMYQDELYCSIPGDSLSLEYGGIFKTSDGLLWIQELSKTHKTFEPSSLAILKNNLYTAIRVYNNYSEPVKIYEKGYTVHHVTGVRGGIAQGTWIINTSKSFYRY